MKKTIFAALVIVGALLAAVGYGYKHRYAASIGIIGGADGPTAIFIAGQTGRMLYIGAALLIAAAILAIAWAIRKKSK